LLRETSAGRGTTPAGIQDPQQAAAWVRGMFGRIAPRYDLLNHLLSMNVDRYWRARTVSEIAPLLADPNARVLDVACGTGDLMFALEARGRARVFGSDFCHPMLVEAAAKAQRRGARGILFEADAMGLPLAANSLDLITIAFGFRNLANYEQALVELLRILKPGGCLAILEFSTPPNRLLARLYDFYSRAILPMVGGWISGSREAYSYLPESVRKFPTADELAGQMRAVGFADVRFRRMTAGVVALHVGQRP
jgi:demethylmenaquinone methyltransferase/2-methoxy-6-polyprenyl-1,4-benzoquinol methylase